MEDEKSVSKPFAAYFKLLSQLCPGLDLEMKCMSQVPYANVMGCLMYLMVCTRFYTSHAVSVVSRYMENLGKEHWNAVK